MRRRQVGPMSSRCERIGPPRPAGWSAPIPNPSSSAPGVGWRAQPAPNPERSGAQERSLTAKAAVPTTASRRPAPTVTRWVPTLKVVTRPTSDVPLACPPNRSAIPIPAATRSSDNLTRRPMSLAGSAKPRRTLRSAIAKVRFGGVPADRGSRPKREQPSAAPGRAATDGARLGNGAVLGVALRGGKVRGCVAAGPASEEVCKRTPR